MAKQGILDPLERPTGTFRAALRQGPLLLALAIVATTLGGLLVGYEPVGGDPDRLYRPLKSELARALKAGELPFWSSRLGLGVPLIAESHVAAFYPPNLLLYRVLDLSSAYRLSMWLHYVALAATTFLYARALGLSSWGSALAGVAFTLCGFQAIHSSHEPFYSVMPYLPLALYFTERYLTRGQFFWLALLALCLGVQWTLGHFQIQMWTGGLVILSGLWRVGRAPRSWGRAFGVIVATIWGAGLAAIQLGLSWQFADSVRQNTRTASEWLYYSFPPAHWFDLVVPWLFRAIRPEGPYWTGQQTSGYEAALYVGTVPLIFAMIGMIGRPASRSAALWRVLIPVSFALATMPRWWPAGFLQLVALPGLGFFRVAARYTLITSLGTAILAGEGFDASISAGRFRRGIAAALAVALIGTAAALVLKGSDPFAAKGSDPFIICGVAWLAAVGIVLLWRLWRIPAWAVVVAAGIELTVLFYSGTTEWGWSIALPAQSPVLSELVRLSPAGLVGGQTENLPVRASLATAAPYLGLAQTPANRLLMLPQELMLRADLASPGEKPDPAVVNRWLKRCRVSHLVGHNENLLALGTLVGSWRDPALDQIHPRLASDATHEPWSIVRLDDVMPEARVAARARTIADRPGLVSRLSRFDDRDQAWFLADDRVPPRPDARTARLVSWDGSVAMIEHDGDCDLVVARSFDPGWLARIGDGPDQPVLPVDGGFLAVRVEGSGRHRVRLDYHPPRWSALVAISAIASAVIAWVLIAALVSKFSGRRTVIR